MHLWDQAELIHAVCFRVHLDAMGKEYLCSVVFAVKNTQVFISYITFECSRKKSIYGKEDIEYVFLVQETNQMFLLNANAVAVNFIIQIGRKFYMK